MIDTKITYGSNCNIDPNSFIGYKEHGGEIILGNNVIIMYNCILRTCTGIIKIGDNVSIGYYSVLHGMGNITIGDNVLISPSVHIYSQNHGIIKDKLIREQKNIKSAIIIGNDVWIGANSLICGNVSISNGVVVGGGSIVTKDIPEYEIWAGNPAKKIGDRQ